MVKWSLDYRFPFSFTFNIVTIITKNVSQVAPFEVTQTVDGLFYFYLEGKAERIPSTTDAFLYKTKCYKESTANKSNTISSNCVREHFIAACEIAKYIGYALGSLIFGILADLFGRRCVTFYGSILYIFVAFLLPFMPSIKAVQIDFVIVCFFVSGVFSVTYVHGFITKRANTIYSSFSVAEMICKKRRLMIIFQLCFHVIGVILVIEVVWKLLENWKYMNIFNTLMLTMIVFGNWYIPESPRWLLTNDEVEKAYLQLKEISGQVLEFEIERRVKHSKKTIFVYIFNYLWKKRLKRFVTIVMLSFVSTFIAFTSKWEVSIPDLDTDQIRILMLLVEIASVLFLVPIYLLLGKRYSLILLFSLLATVSLVDLIENGNEKIVSYSNMFGLLFGSACASLIWWYALDLVPTFLRCTLLGCSLAAYSVTVVAAFLIIDAAGINNLWVRSVSLILSILAIISAVLLPRMVEHDLPNYKLFQ